jgi:hypothetical protein
MPETLVDQPVAEPGISRRRFPVMIILLVVAAVVAAAAWYAWQSGTFKFASSEETPAPLLAPVSPATQSAAIAAANDAALSGATAKVYALEQRLAELNQQAASAAGQASHAEALLVAFAARRAIERGQPLGYLETQLRVRFGDGQPNAVNRVISAAQKPLTVPMLSEQLAQLEPQLIGGSATEGGWSWISRQMSELFVIRHESATSPTVENRVQRAREAMAGGRIASAIAEVERMPGKDAAREWLTRARELIITERALDQLETASLAFPLTPQIAAPAPAPSALPSPSPEPSASTQ